MPPQVACRAFDACDQGHGQRHWSRPRHRAALPSWSSTAAGSSPSATAGEHGAAGPAAYPLSSRGRAGPGAAGPDPRGVESTCGLTRSSSLVISRGAQVTAPAVVTIPCSSGWPGPGARDVLPVRRAQGDDGGPCARSVRHLPSERVRPGFPGSTCRPRPADPRCGPSKACRYSPDGRAQPDPGGHVRHSAAPISHTGLLSAGRVVLFGVGDADLRPVPPPGLGHPDQAHAARAGQPLTAGRVDGVGAAGGVHVPEGLGGVHPERHARRAAQLRRLGDRLHQAAGRDHLGQVHRGRAGRRTASARARPGQPRRRRGSRSR